MQFKARESGIDYEQEFGLNLNTLGCVMLDLEFDDKNYFRSIAEEIGLDEYKSDNPEQWWINGLTEPNDYHVTLRYGLLPTVRGRHCDKVMLDFRLDNLLFHDVFDSDSVEDGYLLPFTLGTFEGFNDEYFVLTAEIEMNLNYVLPNYIQAVHNALGVLPNVQTFSPSTFHMTIGYFKGSSDAFEISKTPSYLPVRIKGIRYGKSMRP